MKSMWTVALVLLLAGSGGAWAQGDPGSSTLEARLSQVEGTVYVHLKGQPDDQFIEAQEDSELEEGDMIRTGEDGRAEISLEGPSVIDVSANTDFTLTSLAPEDTIFGLSFGSLIAKIKKLSDSQQMHFKTPTAVAAVRGTELAVEQQGDGEPARVGVYDEGHVAVSQPGRTEQVQLGPGQETEVRAGAPLGQPRPLAALLAGRARLGLVRQRQEFWRANWRPRAMAQRRAMRRTLLRRRVWRARELRRVSPIQRRPWKAMGPRRRQMQGALARPAVERRRQAFERRRAPQQRRRLNRRLKPNEK